MTESVEEVRRAVLAEVTAAREDLTAAERRTREALADLREQNETARQRWREETAAATRDGTQPPPPPMIVPGVHLTNQLHRLADQRQTLAAREHQALAAAVDRVQAGWADVLPGLQSRALVLLAEVDAIAAEVGGWRALLHDTRAAADRLTGALDGPGARTPAPGRLQAVEVLGAGRDPLAPAPLPGRRDGEPVVLMGDRA